MKVGMVSIYPPPESKHAKLGGVASYTRNLVVSLLNNCKVAVFADGMSHTNNEHHEGAMVYRCWSKGILYPFQIFKKLLSSAIDIVHVQHETYLYGGLDSALVFPLLLALIRLLRKPVILTLHGVIPLSRVNRSFLKENWINGNPFAMKVGSTSLVKSIVSLSTAIIVHEEPLKEILIKEYKCSASKIHVIHHGIEERNDLIKKNEAKEKLGLSGKKVILFFGYITGYKNVELLIDSAKFLKVPEWVMLIAGGAHPRLNYDLGYLKYLSDLRRKASAISNEKILFKGFVSEEEISLYFSAADLVVFPHNICISSSGPLSLTVSYGKPFLVANSFRETVDFDDIVFGNDPKELASKIDFFFRDASFSLRILEYSKDFKDKRLWSRVSLQTYELYKKVALID
jgi:glycosyltransferase involved in cell wall biosynthesis